MSVDKRITFRQEARGGDIAALQLDTAGALNGTTGAATVRIVLPTTSAIIRIAVTQNTYIRFGDNTVTATAADFIIPAGAEYFKVPLGVTDLAFLQVTDGGRIGVSAVI